MCKESKSKTTNAPPQWLQDQLQSFLGGAQGLMGGDPNSLVAPFNPQQERAFRNINQLANHQFGQSDIDQYMSPYQQDVIDATQKQLQLGDAQQQNALKGNTISQGALGGDRDAVVAAQLAGQQDTANNATIAGLENQGYEQALNAYQTANQQQMQEYQQQLGAGTLQQQNAQQILDVPYQQYDFLGNLFGDLGGLFGGTSETTQQQPFSIKSGGSVPHMDDGGVTRNIFMPFGGESNPGQGGRAHKATLNVPNAPAPAPSGGGLSDLAGANSMLKGLGVKNGISGIPDALGMGSKTAAPDVANFMNLTSPLGVAQSAPAAASLAAPAAATAASAAAPAAAAAIGADAVAAPAIAAGATEGAVGLADLLPMIFLAANGGRIPKRAGGGIIGALGGGIPGLLGISPKAGLLGLAPQLLEDGGDVSEDAYPLGATALSPEDTPPNWNDLVTNHGAARTPNATPQASPDPTWSDGTPVASKSMSDAGAPSGLKPGYYSPPKEGPSPWLSVATGVLGALASRSLSKGALAGLQEYQRESDLEANPTVDHSGPSVHIRYANGSDFDTGVPTEAALNLKATQTYRADQMAARQAALDAENQRAADSLAERRDRADQTDREFKQRQADLEESRNARLAQSRDYGKPSASVIAESAHRDAEAAWNKAEEDALNYPDDQQYVHNADGSKADRQTWINGYVDHQLQHYGYGANGSQPQARPQAAPQMSPADQAQSLANARAAIKSRPDRRAAILGRLQAAGIPIQGL